MDYWGQAGVISAAVLGAATLMWKIRRDEIADLKESIAKTLTEQLTSLSNEIQRLRDWRHDFGQKEMVYDDFGHRLHTLEDRVTELERKVK